MPQRCTIAIQNRTGGVMTLSQQTGSGDWSPAPPARIPDGAEISMAYRVAQGPLTASITYRLADGATFVQQVKTTGGSIHAPYTVNGGHRVEQHIIGGVILFQVSAAVS